MANIMEDILFTKENTDSVVFSIVKQFKERARIGKEKYGTDLDRDDLSLNEWLQHAQEEHMDAILYLEKIKKVIDNKIVVEKCSDEANNVIIIDNVQIEYIKFIYAASMSLFLFSIMIFSGSFS
jgi:hypothetical protein